MGGLNRGRTSQMNITFRAQVESRKHPCDSLRNGTYGTLGRGVGYND